MQNEPRDTPEVDRDSSEVVTGPIGSAHLVDPTKAEALGADLDELPGVEIGDDPAAATTDKPAETPRP